MPRAPSTRSASSTRSTSPPSPVIIPSIPSSTTSDDSNSSSPPFPPKRLSAPPRSNSSHSVSPSLSLSSRSLSGSTSSSSASSGFSSSSAHASRVNPIPQRVFLTADSLLSQTTPLTPSPRLHSRHCPSSLGRLSNVASRLNSAVNELTALQSATALLAADADARLAKSPSKKDVASLCRLRITLDHISRLCLRRAHELRDDAVEHAQLAHRHES